MFVYFPRLGPRLGSHLGSRLATQGAFVAALALGACSDPTLNTDLRPDGPPEVLTVLVMNDSTDAILETATFCKMGDEKRPGVVGAPPGSSGNSSNQICPEDLTKQAPEVTDAVPTGWYARVEFDELLDANIEELIPTIDPMTMQPDGTYSGSLATTQPFILTCAGATVPYDGYYSPSGNSVTWPLGPSLYVAPLDPTSVPTGAECSLSLKDNITDKTGNPVPMDQRGPYKFKISELQFLGSTPAPPDDPTMPETIAPDAPVVLTFNALVDATSLLPGEITLRQVTACDDTTGAVTRTALVTADPDDPASIDVTDSLATDAWIPNKLYLLEFTATADVKDIAGGTGTLPGAADFSLCFMTDM